MENKPWVIDKTPDLNDQASALSELANETAILNVRARNKPKQVKNRDGTWPEPCCVECGEDIPIRRLEITGSNLCVDCAEFLEGKRK